MRTALDRILEAALEAVAPGRRLRSLLQLRQAELETPLGTIHLDRFRKVWLLALGKAAVPMAIALEGLLGPWLERGQAVAPHGSPGHLSKTRIWPARHPEPDRAGAAAANRILQWLRQQVRSDDLLVLALSGGGSALFPAPVPGVSLKDKQVATRALLRSGASIQEINALRKHLSRSKGGRLLEALNGARVLTLAVSDVVGDDLSSIASGPVAADSSTYQDCLRIITRYDLAGSLPESVRQHLEKGDKGLVPETLKKGDPHFDGVQSVIVANNRSALEAAAEEAAKLGYPPLILTSSLTGDNRAAAGFLASLAREVVAHDSPLPAPCCLLSGGECTVVVRGHGLGGRNQDMALAFSQFIDDWNVPFIFASLGTDGIDGPTEAAGAQVLPDTILRAREQGLDPADFLLNYDSFHFFEQLGDLIITGPTQTNVMDIQVLLIGKPG